MLLATDKHGLTLIKNTVTDSLLLTEKVKADEKGKPIANLCTSVFIRG